MLFRSQSLINGFVVGGIALAMVATLSAQSVGTAKVVRIKGSARYATVANQWQPLSVGAELRPGAVVQTGMEQGSYVDLVLTDGGGSSAVGSGTGVSPTLASDSLVYTPARAQNVVRLWENTVLGIDTLRVMDTGADKVTETQLDLRSGRILGTVKKMSAASKYEVKIPNGVAGIRGTTYELRSTGELRVLDGTVVISLVAPDGSVTTKTINANQEFNPRTGAVAAIPATVESQLIASSTDVGATRVTDETIRFVRDRTIYFVSPVAGEVQVDDDFDIEF